MEKVEMIEPIVAFVGEQEVEDFVPWSCHCGSSGISVVFKGIKPVGFDICENCQCKIPINILKKSE